MNGDVHERVGGCNDEQRGHEPGGEAQRTAEDPLCTDGDRQRERHCEDAAEQVGDGQATEEHVGARSHAAVPRDDHDDEGVAEDREGHDGQETGRQQGALRHRPEQRLSLASSSHLLHRRGLCEINAGRIKYARFTDHSSIRTRVL